MPNLLMKQKHFSDCSRHESAHKDGLVKHVERGSVDIKRSKSPQEEKMVPPLTVERLYVEGPLRLFIQMNPLLGFTNSISSHLIQT